MRVLSLGRFDLDRDRGEVFLERFDAVWRDESFTSDCCEGRD
jgi:hypothetical protein